MAINFPDSPANNDSFTSNNKTWVFDGTVWNITSGTNSVADGAITTAKLASDAVTTAKITDANITAAKIASSAVTEAKIGDGAVTQAKLTSGLSGITITTSSLVGTVITSPFTNQFAFFSDTNVLSRWNGSAWVSGVATAPTEGPTSLTLDSVTTTTATISFAAGATGGLPITNYQYALSTNGGSSYGSYNALASPDSTSPIVIPGLTLGTAYYIKLKAVNAQGVSNAESSALSFSTSNLSVETLLVAGGGGGGNRTNGGRGSPGGAGGLIYISSFPIGSGTYAVTIAGATALDTQGSNSVISGNGRTLTALGGGAGKNYDNQGPGTAGGSSGGGWYPTTASSAPTQPSTTNDGISNYPTSGFGNAGGTSGSTDPYASGGGGAGGVGANFNSAGGPVGGIGKEYSISGTATYYAGGGGGSGYGGGTRYAGGLGGGGRGDNGSDSNADRNGTANTGGGGGSNGTGGSGIAIIRYLTADATGLTITGGTATTSGSYTVRTFTATGNLVIA